MGGIVRCATTCRHGGTPSVRRRGSDRLLGTPGAAPRPASGGGLRGPAAQLDRLHRGRCRPGEPRSARGSSAILLIAASSSASALGNLLQWLTIRGSGLSLSMALVLTDDHVELVSLGLLGGKRRFGDGARTIPYADLLGAEDEGRAAAAGGCGVRTPQDEIRLDAGALGAAGPRRP